MQQRASRAPTSKIRRKDTHAYLAWVLITLAAGCAKSRRAQAPDGGSDATPCRDEAEALVQLDGDWAALAVGHDAIYLGREAIWRLPKRPVAALEHFADSPARVTKIALQGDTLFWLTTSGDARSALLMADEKLGVIRDLNFAQGTEVALKGARGVTLFASDEFLVAGFAVDSALHRIVRVAQGSATVAPFVDIPTRGAFELAADDDRVYARTDGAIGAWDDSGLLYDTPGRAVNLVADDTFLYWRNEDDGTLVRSPKRALTPIELGSAPGGELVLAIDEASDHLYWTDDTGSLFRVPKAGGSAELVASTGGFDDDDYNALLALDETSVYWLGGVSGRRAEDDDPVWLYRICK